MQGKVPACFLCFYFMLEYSRYYERCGFHPWVKKTPWRRKQQPTPIFLPGKFHGQRSLVGYSPWGCKESDTTEQLSTQFQVYSKVIQLYIYMYLLFFKFFSHLGYYKILSSLCQTVGPCWLYILNTAVCTGQSQTPNLSLFPSLSSGNHEFFL